MRLDTFLEWGDVILAWQCLGYIHISSWEFELGKRFPLQLKHIFYHEKAHQAECFQLVFRDRQAEEVRAEMVSLSKLIKEDGLSVDDAVKLAADYRFLKKYGLTMDEFKQKLITKMSEESGSGGGVKLGLG